MREFALICLAFSLSHLWAPAPAMAEWGETPETITTPDQAMIEIYRAQLMADPSLLQRAQEMIASPYSAQTDTLIDKAYLKVMGREPSAFEKTFVKDRLSHMNSEGTNTLDPANLPSVSSVLGTGSSTD